MKTIGELDSELRYLQDVVGYKNVQIEFELVWVFDDFYVNVWDVETKQCLEWHLSSKGDFERVWQWLATNYPEVDWDEQDF